MNNKMKKLATLRVDHSIKYTLQTRRNADVGIHNIRPRYKWVALYRGILLRNNLRNVIKYEMGVHTQTALSPIPRYIGSHYIGSTV